MVVGEWSTLKVITSKRGENGKFLAENGDVGSDVNAPHSTTTSIVTLFAGSSAQPSYPSSTFDADCSWAIPRTPTHSLLFSSSLLCFFVYKFFSLHFYIIFCHFSPFDFSPASHRAQVWRKFSLLFALLPGFSSICAPPTLGWYGIFQFHRFRSSSASLPGNLMTRTPRSNEHPMGFDGKKGAL